MRPRTLLAAISPCPNDTSCFHPWAAHRIDSPIRLHLSLLDIERLNILATTSAPYDITKISAACLADVADTYTPLRSGAAFAIRCGPKIVSKNQCDIQTLPQLRLAVPGRRTSAFRATSLLYGPLFNIVEMPYSQIMHSVFSGACDSGILIHESHMAVESRYIVTDIGQVFLERFGFPLPLGLIVAKKSLGAETLGMIDEALYQSIRLARQSPVPPFVFQYAQELSPEIVHKHIEQYVTDETERMSQKDRDFLDRFARLLDEDGPRSAAAGRSGCR